MASSSVAGNSSVLVIEHEADAGPALFGEWLEDGGLRLEPCRPYEDDPVPERCRHGGLLVLGGAMGASDDLVAPWLPAVRSLLARAISDRTPTLGICLGAQLLALAAGGRVGPATAGPEIGVCRLDLRPCASSDPLFAPLRAPLVAAQWHLDAITSLPPGSVLLASSERCEAQAFRLGECCWGVQFHPEVDQRVAKLWAVTEHSPDLAPGLVEAAVAEIGRHESQLTEIWRGLGDRFAAVVRNRGAHA